jgi:hypothetical protein
MGTVQAICADQSLTNSDKKCADHLYPHSAKLSGQIWPQPKRENCYLYHTLIPSFMHSKFSTVLSFFLIMGSTALQQNVAQGQINLFEINETLIGVGNVELDLNDDGNIDFNLEIILLPNESLAARVQAVGGSLVLDNSGFGYPDGLVFGDPVQGLFAPGNGVLGTFNNAGRFNGQGIRYLGLRVAGGAALYDGWLKLDVSAGSDTIAIMQGAYQSEADEAILAGEGEGDVLNVQNDSGHTLRLYPNPAATYVGLVGLDGQASQYTLISPNGAVLLSGRVTERIDIALYPAGFYFIKAQTSRGTLTGKLLIVH